MTDMATAPNAAQIAEASVLLDQNFDLFADVSMRVSVQVGTASMTLADLLALGHGSIVELDRQADDPLDILANGTLIARGEIVTVDGRYAIRVTEIVDRRTGGERRSPGPAGRRAA